jgi:PAS domain-containing protein
MSVRQLQMAAVLLVVATFLLALAWAFGLEDLVDPYLFGTHHAEGDAERWEFVVVVTLLVGGVAGMLLLFGQRTLRTMEQRQVVQALVYAGFERGPEAAFATDGERVIVAENRRCRELLGPHLGVLVGRSFHEFLPLDLTDSRYLEFEISLRDHGYWHGDFVTGGRLGDVRLTLELVMVQSEAGVATSLHGRVAAVERVLTAPPSMPAPDAAPLAAS